MHSEIVIKTAIQEHAHDRPENILRNIPYIPGKQILYQ